MNSKIVALILLLFPMTIFSQELYRPLLDPSIACSYGNPNNPIDSKTNEMRLVNYYFIVTEMPKPKILLEEIEKMLKKQVRLSKNELKLSGTIIIQCLVNCEGKAGDFQVISCSEDFVNVGSQVINVLRAKLDTWKPGKQRDRSVDVLVKIKVLMDSGKFEVVAPFY